jgi:hypothetical protein
MLPAQIIVRRNSPLHDRYEEFGLANNHPYEWCTRDGTNTLPIRIVRRFVVRQAYANPDFSMEHLVDAEEILNIPINEAHTAADLYRLLDELFRRAGCLPRFHAALDDWAGRRRWFQRFSPARSRGKTEDYAPVFQALDKDSPEGRKRLYGIILDSLRALKRKMPERSAIAA